MVPCRTLFYGPLDTIGQGAGCARVWYAYGAHPFAIRAGGCILRTCLTPLGRPDMSTMRILTAAAFAAVFAVSTASAQQAQRVAGMIDKVEGNTLYIKSASGPVTLMLADNALVVARAKASAADIKPGDYVATGGVPQPDGTQNAVELRIFPESM